MARGDLWYFHGNILLSLGARCAIQEWQVTFHRGHNRIPAEHSSVPAGHCGLSWQLAYRGGGTLPFALIEVGGSGGRSGRQTGHACVGKSSSVFYNPHFHQCCYCKSQSQSMLRYACFFEPCCDARTPMRPQVGLNNASLVSISLSLNQVIRWVGCRPCNAEKRASACVACRPAAAYACTTCAADMLHS